jgi:hypothetical protein
MCLKTLCQIVLLTSVSTTPLSRQNLSLRTETATSGLSCSVDVLPPPVRAKLNVDYAAWKIQDIFSLSPSARRNWEYRRFSRPSECPGISAGTFDDGSEAYALLLVPRARPERAYRFVVFSNRQDEPAYRLTTVEASEKGGAQNLFIRSVRMSDVFDHASRRKLGIKSTEGVLILESGKSELFADVFFWTKDGYRHEPMEY